MKRLWLAFLNSLSGIKLAFAQEAAFRQELLASIVLLPLAWHLAGNGVELALLWLGVLIVLVVELINTAIEAAIDRIGEEIHPLAKKAKDTASAAVLVALVNCACLWACVLVK